MNIKKIVTSILACVVCAGIAVASAGCGCQKSKSTSGSGNNGEDLTEGVRYHNCIGTYLHGPLLPKNPRITDFLIKKALDNKTGKIHTLKALNDQIEQRAHKVASKRPR